jgi:hypothetical protein
MSLLPLIIFLAYCVIHIQADEILAIVSFVFLMDSSFFPWKNRNSAGFVYMRFENMQAAINAQHALHGRWFAGKLITATFMVSVHFLAMLVISLVNTTYVANEILHTCRCPRPTRLSFLTADRSK